MKAAKESML